MSPDEMFNPVTKPRHYNTHPSGIDCIKITEHMNFCIGNAVKYLWRAGEKGETLEDLKKARWYVDREIQRLEGAPGRYKPVDHQNERPDDYPPFCSSPEFKPCYGCHSHVCVYTAACGRKVDDPH